MRPLVPPQAYWRSCAALLGQVLETAFKDDFTVELLSTPEVPGTRHSVYVSKSIPNILKIAVELIFG